LQLIFELTRISVADGGVRSEEKPSPDDRLSMAPSATIKWIV
jgi:hypothetical protein